MAILAKDSKKQQTDSSSLRTRYTGLKLLHNGSSVFKECLRYCLAGGANTIIDVLVLNLLLWRFTLHNIQFLVVYNSVAYASGALSSLLLNNYWTFRRQRRPTRRNVGRFIVSLVLEIFLNNGLLWLAGMVLHPFIANITLWSNLAKLLAMAGSAIFSYLCMRFWVFTS